MEGRLQVAAQRKVHHIFQTFDRDKKDHLDKDDMTEFVRTVNPGVHFTNLQIDAIVSEVFEEYARFVGAMGLSPEGLEQIYSDGIGDVDIDFATLGLKLDPATEVISRKPSLAEALSVGPRDGTETALSLEKLDPQPLLEREPTFSLARKLSGADSLPDLQAERSSRKQNNEKQSLMAATGKVAAHTVEDLSSLEQQVFGGAFQSSHVISSPAAADSGFQFAKQAESSHRSTSEQRLLIDTTLEGLQPSADVAPHNALVPGAKDSLEIKQSRAVRPRLAQVRSTDSPRRLRPSPRSTEAGAGQKAEPASPLGPRPASPSGRRVAALVQNLEVSSPNGKSRAPSPGPRAGLEHATRGSLQNWSRKGPSSPGPKGGEASFKRQSSSQDFGALKWAPSQLSDTRSNASDSSLRSLASEVADRNPLRGAARRQWSRTSQQSNPESAIQAPEMVAGEKHGAAFLPNPAAAEAIAPALAAAADAIALRPDNRSLDEAAKAPSDHASDSEGEGRDELKADKTEAPAPAHSLPKLGFEAGNKKHFALIHHRITDSRASDVGSIIHAHKDDSTSSLGDIGEDDVFDEVDDPNSASIYKLPSAISIEARTAGNVSARTAQHSRVPSAVGEIVPESAAARQLTVVIPQELNRTAGRAAALNQSPASSAQAEKEAEVGYESLDSNDFAPGPEASAADEPVQVSAEEVRQEMCAVFDAPSLDPRRCRELRNRAGGVPEAQAAFDIHAEMGQVLAKRQHYEESVASFRAALSLESKDAQIFFRLGNVLFQLQRFSEADSAFRAGLKVVKLPKEKNLTAKLQTNLGIALEAQGLLLGACEHYREAAELNPKHYRAFKLLGGASYAAGDLPAAKAALERALQLHPVYPDAFCDLGCTLCALGDAEGAMKAFDSVIKLDPQHAEALFNKGNLARQCGRHEAALECYKAVLEQQPSHWRSALNSAVALVGLQRPEEAHNALRKALEMSGQAEEVADEVEQLKRLAGKRATPRELTRIASAIAKKTSSVPPPLQPTPKKLFQGPADSDLVDKVAAAKRPTAGLDLYALKKLAPLTEISTEQLRAAFELQAQELLSEVKAEEVLRDLLRGLTAKRFGALMRAVSAQLLPPLKAEKGLSAHSQGLVEGKWLLACLAVLCDEPWGTRSAAMFTMLAETEAGVPEEAAQACLKLCKAAFGAQLNSVGAGRLCSTAEELEQFLVHPQFGLPMLETLPFVIQDTGK